MLCISIIGAALWALVPDTAIDPDAIVRIVPLKADLPTASKRAGTESPDAVEAARVETLVWRTNFIEHIERTSLACGYAPELVCSEAMCVMPSRSGFGEQLRAFVRRPMTVVESFGVDVLGWPEELDSCRYLADQTFSRTQLMSKRLRNGRGLSCFGFLPIDLQATEHLEPHALELCEAFAPR